MKKNTNPDFSVISRGEIIIGMQQAKDPVAQKKIYADICCCTEAAIEHIIEEDRMKKTWTEEQIKELCKMVAENIPYSKIAEHFGKNASQVATKVHDLRKHGVLPHPKTNAYCGEQNAAPTPIEQNAAPGELEYYKERCAALEVALECKINELLTERTKSAELRILAGMIGRAAQI